MRATGLLGNNGLGNLVRWQCRVFVFHGPIPVQLYPAWTEVCAVT